MEACPHQRVKTSEAGMTGLFCPSANGQQGERASHGAGGSSLFTSKDPRPNNLCLRPAALCVFDVEERNAVLGQGAGQRDRGTEGRAGSAHGSPQRLCPA